MPRRPAPKFSAKASDGAVVLTASGAVDALALAHAAYLMTADAYVALGKNSVWLRPKSAKVDLAARFESLYSEQLAFWKQARADKGDRAETQQRALALANPTALADDAFFGELSEERKAEIAALLAEPPVDDVKGIARTWLETRKKGN
jgi:hypothetical protein